jgi:tetratricopeptide (TPR) repeat protein
LGWLSTYFTKVISLQPDRYKAYAFRGMIKFRAQDYAAAIADEDKAIALKPDFPEAWFYRGDAKMENKDFDGALADLDKAIALKPNDALSYYTKGLTEFVKRDYLAAITVFTQTIALNDPAHTAQSYYWRGLAETHTDQQDAACADFDKALAGGWQGAAAAKEKHCH